MIEIKKLYKHYGDFVALNNLDLSIGKGELFGFVGPNGAGKTTTMRILSGLLKADGGEVYIGEVNALEDNQALKKKIGYMPDFFGVYDNLKAIEYMEFYASIYGITGKKARKLCMELMELVNLSDKAEFYVDSLSRGMKQRLCLARSLVHNPDLLILDEPASGLDPRARFEMKGILKNLNDMGKTIIISSHILSELAEMCTTIGIIEKGSMITKGTVDEIMSRLVSSNPIKVQIIENKEEAVKIFKEEPLVKNISIDGDYISLGFTGEQDDEAELLAKLIRNNIKVVSFVRESGNLEEVFMMITGNKEVLN
ncbi:MAG: ABC transporter ATP-binding protein [Lachnospiraceae bacterium]|nr:ABC transporter ATP-binding protein [Lachnospiraceae bacterium]MBQ2320192.1 ABC transporter ATP-binding protein [Lachnospiraceae bacterium]